MARISSDTEVATASPAVAETATAEGAASVLERYKVSLRRYSPVQKGLAGLPWKGEWQCGRCGETSPGRLLHEAAADTVALEH